MIPLAPRDPAEAAQQAALRRGIDLPGYIAHDVADAVLSWYKDVVHTRYMIMKEQWTQAHRDFIYPKLRRELAKKITDEGLVPIRLPSEDVKYFAGLFYSTANNISADDIYEGNALRELPENSDMWEVAVISMEVPVRVPPVNRAEAVKAGILTGPPTREKK